MKCSISCIHENFPLYGACTAHVKSELHAVNHQMLSSIRDELAIIFIIQQLNSVNRYLFMISPSRLSLHSGQNNLAFVCRSL